MKTWFISRFVSALLVSLALFFLSLEQIVFLFVVAGQGHFISTYYFQYKAGRIDKSYLLKYVVLAVLLFGSFYLWPWPKWLVLITSFYFVIHFLQDEKFLLGHKPSPRGRFDIWPLTLVFFVLLFDQSERFFECGQPFSCVEFLPQNSGNYFLYVLLGLALALILYKWIFKKYEQKSSSVCFDLSALGLIAGYFFFDGIHIERFMGGIILFHYLNWYVHFGLKWWKDGERLQGYLIAILVINLLVFAGFRVSILTNWEYSALKWVYLPYYFYLWTLLHLVFTTRKKDGFYWFLARSA